MLKELFLTGLGVIFVVFLFSAVYFCSLVRVVWNNERKEGKIAPYVTYGAFTTKAFVSLFKRSS